MNDYELPLIVGCFEFNSLRNVPAGITIALARPVRAGDASVKRVIRDTDTSYRKSISLFYNSSVMLFCLLPLHLTLHVLAVFSLTSAAIVTNEHFINTSYKDSSAKVTSIILYKEGTSVS